MTGLRLAPLRRIAPSLPTESPSPQPQRSTPHTPLSSLPTIPQTSRRTLDFDLEAVAAGYADPQWVPSTVTAWAYCWVGTSDVVVEALPPRDFYDLGARRQFLLPLLDAVAEADVLTGHNIIRFDLPLLNAECMKVGLPRLGAVLAQDTIRVGKAKGFKKGMDNIAHVLGVEDEKLPLNWAEWQAAYGEPDLATVKERCASDVLMHIKMRERMRKAGWLAPPRLWSP